MNSAKINAGPFADFEKEIEEMNAAGKGYQGLLRDLEIVGTEAEDSPAKPYWPKRFRAWLSSRANQEGLRIIECQSTFIE